jgi:8-oxo-dGTP pyrophosphatase MutT (NUDIX family)
MAKKKSKVAQQHAALPYLVVDGAVQVLLVTSRQTGRWVIPKGWPMKGLKPHQAAAREAYEEAGIEGTVWEQPVAVFTYLKRLSGDKRKRCTVDIYPIAVERQLDDWPEREQRQREWMSPAEAASRVAEAELRTFLAGFTLPV